MDYSYPMMKTQELAALDVAIKTLGPNSYLGPWLASVRGEVERDLRSDLEPMALPSETVGLAAAIIAEAKLEATRILDKARLDADNLGESARRERMTVMSACAATLRDAQKRIEGRVW